MMLRSRMAVMPLTKQAIGRGGSISACRDVSGLNELSTRRGMPGSTTGWMVSGWSTLAPKKDSSATSL